MRCSASPTTFTAPSAAERPEIRVLEAMIFAEVLRPLAKDFGPFGEVALGAVAQHAFVSKNALANDG